MKKIKELVCRTKPELSAEIKFEDNTSQHFYGQEAKEVSIGIFKKEFKFSDVEKMEDKYV